MVQRRVRGGKYKIKHVEKQCPVELGEELLVNITDVCPSGDGMSKIRGYVIMVPKAKPRMSENKGNTSRRKSSNWRNNQIILSIYPLMFEPACPSRVEILQRHNEAGFLPRLPCLLTRMRRHELNRTRKATSLLETKISNRLIALKQKEAV